MAAPASPDSPPPARDPRAYTPKHLADKILQSKSALEGELTRALARVHTWPITLEICRALRTLDFHGDPRR